MNESARWLRPQSPGTPIDAGLEGGTPVARKAAGRTRTSAVEAARATRQPEISQEEQILRAATLYLIQNHGMFLVATAAREARIRGVRVWIITVTLRFARGHEGYIGDLLYDGEQFTFLTEQALMDERAQKIAEDPEGLREWNDYRDSTLHSGEA
jgi:hypothetical protein